MPQISFTDFVADDMVAPIVAISDGTTTVYAAGYAVDAVVEAYAATYDFNGETGPARVEVSVYRSAEAAEDRDYDDRFYTTISP